MRGEERERETYVIRDGQTDPDRQFERDIQTEKETNKRIDNPSQ